MDKNTVIGFVLIAAVLIGFSWWSKPSEEQIKAQQEQAEKLAAEQKKAAEERKAQEQKQAEAIEEAKKDTTALFHQALSGTAQDIVLENDSLQLTVNTKGGTVTKAFIKGHKNNYALIKGSKPSTTEQGVTLFDETEQSLEFIIEGKEHNIRTADLFFTPSEVTPKTLTLTADAGEGRQLVMTYRLGDDYMLHYSLQAVGMENLFSAKANSLIIDWQEKCRQQERGFSFENRYASLTYKEKDSSTDNLSEAKDVIDEDLEESLDWVAFKTQFFSSMMIAKTDFAAHSKLTSRLMQKESGYLKQYHAQLETSFDPTGKQPTQLEFYYGPNDFQLLKDVEKQSEFGKDLEMERLVYLGWPLFRVINRWFTLYVFDWLTNMHLNMGIVLIIITLLLKFITYPLVKKSYMSSAKMRVLKPKLDAATKQYDKPEDQMKKQQAMMQMYSQYGVSPMGGCLPMLVQMPIWIAMFNFVPNAIQLRGESFLWINDLSTYDPVFEWGNNVWLIGDHLSLTCILFCVSNLLYSWMTMRQQRDQMVGSQAQQMKMFQWMMFLMPVMFFFIFNDYSAGLNFYYFISLFFSAAIMWTLRKTTNDEKLLAILEANYKANKANPKKTSGLAARLEAMQKQQQEMQRRREELERRKRK